MSRHVLFVLSADGKKEACRMRESIDVRFNKAVTLAIGGDKLGKNESLNGFPVPQGEPRCYPRVAYCERHSPFFLLLQTIEPYKKNSRHDHFSADPTTPYFLQKIIRLTATKILIIRQITDSCLCFISTRTNLI